MKESDVLIVGAGPSGLALALFLARNGVTPRIVEKSAGPGEASRAMVVQARTLEFYRQLGFADEMVRRGIPLEHIRLREGGKETAVLKFGDFGAGLSPYPFALSFPQDDHERLLGERLAAAGLAVEWETELVNFKDRGDGVQCTLHGGDGEETFEAAYLCGCDGSHSGVRRRLNLEFSGGTYEQVFYVADVSATGDGAGNNDLNMCLSTDAFCLLFPIRSTGMNRVIGIVPEELAGRDGLTFAEIQPYVEKLVNVHITKVNWSSTYRVHHRVADHFRQGRVFIAGDAGHVHSPAGGQGMNTGIGDAVNLSWKLASVVSGRADSSILDTYETERIAFAQTLVESTDKAFQSMVGRTLGSRLFRTMFVPHIAPLMLGFGGFRKQAFRAVSQTRIHYRESALSAGSAGDVHGGDRLPWVGSIDNFEPLGSCEWQVHVYGAVQPALYDAAGSVGLALHEFAWSDNVREAGLQRDAMYLVRPDGYVALASGRQDEAELRAYLSKFGIVARGA